MEEFLSTLMTLHAWNNLILSNLTKIGSDITEKIEIPNWLEIWLMVQFF